MWFAAQTAIAIVAVVGHHGTLQGLGYSDPILRFGEFLGGMVAALEIKQGWRIQGRARWALPVGLLAGALAATRLMHGDASEALIDAYFAPAFLVIVIAAAQRDLNAANGWLRSRWLVYAGQVSFCFYLVHELILVNVNHELGSGYGTAVLSLVAAMVVAAGLHHAVELPCQKMIRKIPLPSLSGRVVPE